HVMRSVGRDRPVLVVPRRRPGAGGVAGGGGVTGGGDRGGELAQARGLRVEADRGGLGGQVHLGTVDAVDTRQRLLDVPHTGGAGHAADVEGADGAGAGGGGHRRSLRDEGVAGFADGAGDVGAVDRLSGGDRDGAGGQVDGDGLDAGDPA